MSDQETIKELRAEAGRLAEMRDRLLQTVKEQGEARAKDYETMRELRYELEWRRKMMGDRGTCTCGHPHASHILKAGPECNVAGCSCRDYAPGPSEGGAP